MPPKNKLKIFIFKGNQKILVENNAVIGYRLAIQIFKDDQYVIAKSKALGLTGYGKSRSEALKSIKTVIELFFEELNSKGTSLRFIKEKGFRDLNSKKNR